MLIGFLGTIIFIFGKYYINLKYNREAEDETPK
jgi:hypothetical protein